MSSGVSSQGSTSPSWGMRRIGQGILVIDRKGGGGEAPGEGDEGVFNPLAPFPRVIMITSHPRVYAFHAVATTAALRIWSRVCARSCGCGCRWELEVCGGGCEEHD